MSSDVPYRKLRVLLVDDNRINLSVLSTLLKRRFSNLIEGTPVSVDSGLKAIQLLRTNVFDCIMMDIQMPFLSGLDTSIRIRNGEDGVLEANRSVHIVAVTTAVGDEPELAYRRAGMDGMIGKPVRFQDMQHYLCPLAHEAFNSASSVDTISLEGDSVMPPLPPTISRSERLFYLPANATIRAPCPDICRGADFEKMLRAQTRASLRNCGAIAVARTGSWSPSTLGRRQLDKEEDDDRISEEDNSKSSVSATLSTDSIESDHIEDLPCSPIGARGRVLDTSPVRPKHSRNASLTISKRTLSQQIQREMDNMEGQSDLSDSGVAKTTIVNRPRAVHRTSSPAWLVTQGLDRDAGDQFVTSPTSPSSPHRLAMRPNWLVSMKLGSPLNASRNYSSKSNGIGSTSNSSSDMDEYEPPLLTPDRDDWVLRRDSQRSNSSVTSDTSTDLPTPANELPVWPTPALDAKTFNRLSNDSSSTVDPLSDDKYVAIACNNENFTSVSQKRTSGITTANMLAHDLQNTQI